MRLRDLLETPISDMTVHELPNSTSFSASDKHLIKSEIGHDKLVRAFSNTPFVFKIHFVVNDLIDSSSNKNNNDVDTHAKKLKAGIHDSFAIKDLRFIGERGVITVVMLSNLSPLVNKMPMTGWTLAHKIGHSIQDHLNDKQWPVGDISALTRRLNKLISGAGGGDKVTEFDPGEKAMKQLTMRSARVKNLNNPFEVFPELLAQYLVTGSVKFVDNDPRLVKMINTAFEKLLKKLVGRVVVEL